MVSGNDEKLGVLMLLQFRFGLFGWLISCFFVSICVVKNIECTKRNYNEWTMFNEQCFGIVQERGWPFCYQHEVRIQSANSSNEEAKTEARNVVFESSNFAITSTFAFLGNFAFVALCILVVLKGFGPRNRFHVQKAKVDRLKIP